MNKLFIYLVSIFFLSTSLLMAKVNIFACEPEWAALAKEITMDQAKIFSATNGQQDPHHIRARPSLISKVTRADVVFCTGASLEEGWLPILLQKAPVNVQRGQDGFFMASDYISLIEKPVAADRSLGHIHLQGNPHIHLNPYNLLIVAEAFSKRMAMIDPVNTDFYHDNYILFSQKWNQKIKNWEKKAASLRGKHVITHHPSFSYLLQWLQMQRQATLEVKPGIAPTTSHLKTLLDVTKGQDIWAILRTPFDADRASLWLSEKKNIPALILAFTVGGDDHINDLPSLFDDMLDNLLRVSQKNSH